MRRIVVLVLAILAVQALGFSQAFRGSLSGSVADASGAAVPNAEVKIVSKGTGLTRSLQTQSAGEFTFPDLVPGIYTVSVSAKGFQSFSQDVEVAVGKIAAVPVTLGVASQTQTVDVQAAAAALETADSTLNAVVDTRAVGEIPLNGRDFTQLLRLTPGYNDTGSMNGARVNENNWQIDGVDNNDFWHNSNAVNQGSISGVAGVLLPIEAIDQFNQQASGGADTGRNPGSNVNAIIKSGTNNLHGSAFYFNRNEALAANNPFNSPGSKNPLLRNENYGFSLGGPIFKNKTFFFIAYEHQGFKSGETDNATVPSQAWINQATTVLTHYGVAVNPVMVRLFNLLWPSNISGAAGTTSNYVGTDPSIYKSDNGIIHLDHNFSERQHVSARAFLGTGEATAFAGSVYGRYFQSVPSRQPNYAVQWDSTFTPRLTNQLLAGVNYFNQTFDDADHGQNIPSTGFNTGVTNPSDFGAPNIEISGFTNGGVGETPKLGRIDTTGHLTDNLAYTLGSHQIKIGGEYRVSRLDVFYQRSVRGAFTFDGTAGQAWNNTSDSYAQSLSTPVKALADFFAGYIGTSQGSISTGDPQRVYGEDSFSWWLADAWKVNNKLTLNYGVRYEYNQPMHEVTDKGISTFLPGSSTGFAIVGQGLSSLYPSDKNNLAPRFGFAYTPVRGGKTVIRGGYGVYYDVLNGTYYIDGRANGGGRGISRNPVGATPVFSVTDGSNTPQFVVQNGVYLFGSSVAAPPFAAFGVDQNIRSPYIQNFNMNVQHQLTKNTLFQIGYVGSQGRKLADKRNINLPGLSTLGPNAPLQSRRPFESEYPNLAGITWLETAANSQYNSLQTSFKATGLHGVTGQISYTLGHARDDMSYARNASPENNSCLKCDYGNADFDIRHNISAYAFYDIPAFAKSIPFIGKGWQVNTFWVAHTGTPFSVSAGQNVSGTFGGSDRANQVNNLYSGVTQPTNASGNWANGYRWFNPAAFALPAYGTFGNTLRNQFYGPGFNSLDFSVFKTSAVGEHFKVQFRVEIFNLFNRLNLSAPDTSLGDGGQFGIITGTVHAGDAPGIGSGEPRNVQLALKLLW